MPETELFVSLKVPDNVAITAFHTLKRLGYHKLKNVERYDYYKFKFSGDKKSFQNKICKIDILVNANKNNYSSNLEKTNLKNNNKLKKINILIQDLGKEKGLLFTLKNRLGFKNIKKIDKGVLWSLSIDSNKEESKKIAIDITKDLLMNENYQKFRIIE